MARRRAARPRRTGGRTARKRWRLPRLLPSAQQRNRWWRRLRATPAGFQIFIGAVALLAVWFLANGVYQVVRKPTELFFPVSDVLHRTPSETWRAYGSVFEKHSTAIITPEFLAALAQVEGSGNPIVRTYWRWSFAPEPFDIYRPASSAVGMYQITNGTFAEARRYCIHDHVVVEDGSWNDPDSCWFNALYTRVLASNAVELTSAYLDVKVRRALAKARITHATLAQKQALAALIHLCGAGAGERYARRGLQMTAGQRCGTHDARGYVLKVESMRRTFARLRAARS